MRNLKLLFYVSCFSILISCNPDDDRSGSNGGNSDFHENFGSQVQRDFIGQVVDSNNQPLKNVNVTIGSESVQSDINGIFILNAASVHQRFAHIKATKAGYINGSRSLVPTSGKNNLKIMLLPVTPIATIASGESSEVAISSGTKVVFDGSFEDENGNAYNGNVAVSMYHLESSNEDFSQLMPGMLYAERESGDEAMLQTFGMLHVELRGSGGQKLQIAAGHTAAITMHIDASQMTTAPTTIPLWHFDEAAGYWIEDGSATREGNYYVGEVSHFSWWNCDTATATVTLTVNVAINAFPIPNAGVELITSTGFTSFVLFTDENGQVGGMIPANEQLTLNIYDVCGEVAYTDQIGPFSVDTELPPIAIPIQTATAQIEGNLLNCEGQPVSEGYVLLAYGTATYFTAVEPDGHFSLTTLKCPSLSTFQISGVDFETGNTSVAVSYDFEPAVTNVGAISTCILGEYIYYQIDSNPLVEITAPYEVGPGGSGLFHIYKYADAQIFSLSWFGTDAYAPGHYSIGTEPDELQFTVSAAGGSAQILEYNGADITVHINNFGNVGEYVDVILEGTYVQNTEQHSIYVVMHVLRDN